MTSMEDQSLIDALCMVDLPEEEHTTPRGHKIVLRGLTHDEALTIQEYAKKDDVTNAMYEQKMLSFALVRPAMSMGQIKAWQKASRASEINDVVKVVQRLSGMAEDEAKSAYKSVPDGSEPGE